LFKAGVLESARFLQANEVNQLASMYQEYVAMNQHSAEAQRMTE
jgi:hypothetical protein